MEKATVLIADDDMQVVDSLTKLLSSAGYTIVGNATNGEEAIWLNQVLKPEVVLMDIKMPKGDGLVAAKKMMATRPVPIVMCTAYYNESLVHTAAKFGVYAYVVKPCKLSDLLPAIDVAIYRFSDNRLLSGEIVTLKETLEARKWIEKAKGIIMRNRNLTEDQAHIFLQQESQRSRRSVAELSQAIVVAEQSLTPKIIGRAGYYISVNQT